MKRRTLILSALAIPAALTACGDKEASTGKYSPIKLGTLSGPHAEIAEIAAKVAAKTIPDDKLTDYWWFSTNAITWN